MTIYIPQLDPNNIGFPPITDALDCPQGLLAFGGDLSVPRLLNAYQQGIFPWYSAAEPILWWAPSPRMVLQPQELHVSRSMAKLLRKNQYHVTFDQAFGRVINYCANRNPSPARHTMPLSALNTAVKTPNDKVDTWIVPDMRAAYTDMYVAGYAHSVEVWEQGQLVGGLYGVSIGKIYFGESMFSLRTNASKVAFIALVRQLDAWDFSLLDCQLPSDHLASLGAYPISIERFQGYLTANQLLGLVSYWQLPKKAI